MHAIVQPSRKPLGCHGGFGAGQAKALEVHDFVDSVWANARIGQRHIATHAVADQMKARSAQLRFKMIQQKIQIGQVIWKPKVVLLQRLGGSKTPPIGRDDERRALELVHQKLKRCAHIHPAVKHHPRGLSIGMRAPGSHMLIVPSDAKKMSAGGTLDAVHWKNQGVARQRNFESSIAKKDELSCFAEVLYYLFLSQLYAWGPANQARAHL